MVLQQQSQQVKKKNEMKTDAVINILHSDGNICLNSDF